MKMVLEVLDIFCDDLKVVREWNVWDFLETIQMFDNVCSTVGLRLCHTLTVVLNTVISLGRFDVQSLMRYSSFPTTWVFGLQACASLTKSCEFQCLQHRV